MSLSKYEEAVVMGQVKKKCPICGDELSAHDDGVSRTTGWGVSGAYVSCETCGYLHEKDAE